MNPFLLPHLGDRALRSGLVAAVPKFRLASATAIAHLAEFDARKLYVPEGYPSMSAFCTGELGLTEQVANKLIRVARTALRFPEIFPALADGRLNPSAVILLAPWLTNENARELLAAATRKSNEAIRELLADRTPKLDVPFSLEARPGPAQVSAQTPEAPGEVSVRTPPDPAKSAEVSVRTPPPARWPKFAALGGERWEARFTMGQATHEAMRYFEQMLGRKITSEEIDQALLRGLEAMAAAIEQRRFAATDRPRKQRRTAKGRHIPAAVKREVRERDGDRCTFVAESGHRCEARGMLEFDHIEPVARVGKSIVENLRLRCRAHNQYEAERAFGAGFMHEKRERAGESARRQGARTAAPKRKADVEATPAAMSNDDVIPWLRKLGFRADEARRAAARCDRLAPLESRVRAALSFLAPPARVGRVAERAAPPTGAA